MEPISPRISVVRSATIATALAAFVTLSVHAQPKPAPRAPEVTGDAVIVTFPDGTRQGTSVMPDGRVYNRKLAAGEALFTDGDLYQVTPNESYRRADGEWKRIQRGENFIPPRERRIIVSARDTQPLPAGVKPPPRPPAAEPTAAIERAPSPPPPPPPQPSARSAAPPDAKMAAPRQDIPKPVAPPAVLKPEAKAAPHADGVTTFPSGVPMRPGDSLPEGAILTATDPYRVYQVRSGKWVEVKPGETLTLGGRRIVVKDAPTLEERQALTIAASNAGLYSATQQMEFLRRRKP